MNVNNHCGSLWYTKKKILIYQNNELISVAQIQRNEVEDHLQTTVTFHLGLALKNVQDTTEKLDLLQQQVQDLAAANTTLSRKVDEQNKTILRLKSDSLDFVWKVTGFREILNESKHENNKMLKVYHFTRQNKATNYDFVLSQMVIRQKETSIFPCMFFS